MSRTRQPGRRAIERFQMSFSPLVPQENAFINEWFSRSWGRRQAWARGLAHLGLTARNSGIRLFANDRIIAGDLPLDALPAGNEELTAPGALENTKFKAHPLTLTLHRKSFEDESCLQQTDQLPGSRKCGWLRDTLLLGAMVQARLPRLLGSIDTVELELQAQKIKEKPFNSVVNGRPASKVGENRKSRGVEFKIDALSAPLEVPIGYEIDVDLSSLSPLAPVANAESSNLTSGKIIESDEKKNNEGDTKKLNEQDVVKRPELLGLFN